MTAIQSPASTGKTSQSLSDCRCLSSRGIGACRLTICQPYQLTLPPDTGKRRAPWVPGSGNDGRAMATQVTVHITEHRGPRGWEFHGLRAL